MFGKKSSYQSSDLNGISRLFFLSFNLFFGGFLSNVGALKKKILIYKNTIKHNFTSALYNWN